MVRYIYSALNNYYLSPKRPLAAYLNLTERCNLKCAFCELGRQKNIDSGERLTSEEICQIIDGLHNWRVEKIHLGGGEALIRQDLWSILEHVASKGVIIWQMLTNGVLLNGLNTTQRSILKKAVKILNVSLDSPNPELHDSIRGVPGTFMRVKHFLEKSAMGKWPQIYITCVITKETYRGIPELIRFLSRHTIKHIGFQPVNFYSNFPDYKIVKDKDRFLLRGKEEIDELGRAIEEGIKISKDLKVSTNLSFLKLFLKEYFLYAKTDIFFFDRLIRNFVCSSVFNYLYIDSKGNLLPCFLLPKIENVIGKDLKETWRRNALEFKKWSLEKRFYPECQSCFCEFAANFRHHLIYHPISNISLITRLFPYYLARTLRM